MDAITGVADSVRSYGFDVRQPVSLRSTNNVVVWLSPSPIVAKISLDHDGARRELTIARGLRELGAPVVAPFDVALEQLDGIEGRTVTWWRYEPQDGVVEPSARQVAEQLSRLHDCLALLCDRMTCMSYAGPLLSAAGDLERPDYAPTLLEPDRDLLRTTLLDGIDRVARRAAVDRVIHGSPHRFNILMVDGAPAFIDFETVAIGPLEWDLAHLEPEVAEHYPGTFDQQALALCRVMVSAATATWCWAGLARGPDMRFHAHHHLAAVRASRL